VHFDGAGDEGVNEDIKCYATEDYPYEETEVPIANSRTFRNILRRLSLGDCLYRPSKKTTASFPASVMCPCFF
jgi:hypothetical protein